MIRSIISATGSYIPVVKVPNEKFLNHEFYDANGVRFDKSNEDIIRKLREITGIEERRYVTDDLLTSDIAAMAAEKALENIDRESLDYIVVGQNLGEIAAGNSRTDIVPSIAARVKHKLKIENPYTVCFDLPFGCPGWLQGTIMADYFIKSGDASRVLVIGAEVLSRITDPHDVDCMIFADGAGATLVEATSQPDVGIVSHVARSDTLNEAYLLRMGKSYNPRMPEKELFVKMDGHMIYKYALKTVPLAIKENLEKAGLDISDVDKILIHQANEKMDTAIVKRLFKMYGRDDFDPNIAPMIIFWTGNSSVATLPTLLDLLRRGKLDGHRIHSGDILVFASVGAGMNVNSMVYRVP